MQRSSSILKALDWSTISVYLLLMVMGWLNIYAAVYSEEHSSMFDLSQRYGSQLLWIGFALLFAIVILLIDSRFYLVFANYIYAFAILVLISVLFFGVEVNASKSWLQVGSIRLQPAEFVKAATALALAKLMSGYNFRMLTLPSLLKIGGIILVPIALILLQNDTGSALVFLSFVLLLYREGLPHWVILFLAFLILLFFLSLILNKLAILAGLLLFSVLLFSILSHRYRDSFRFVAGIIGLGAALYAASEFFGLPISAYQLILIPIAVGIPIVLIYSFYHKIRSAAVLLLFLIVSISFSLSVDYVFHRILEKHHKERIMDMLGIETDPLGYGYNLNQSKIAIGSGGFTGKGYLQGTQTKFNFVPEQGTDFIFCTVGEEWGFVGSVVVLGLFLFFLLRLIVIAERQKEAFARIYGYGVVSIFAFHILINVGMTIGLFPVIGIPLPFFSYGGSSLWAFTILLFILLKFDSSRRN